MTPEQTARISLDIGREVTELVQRRLAEATRKHRFWAAGEADCPREIKASNGELHTLRCKVCGQNSPRNDFCPGAPVREDEAPIGAFQPWIETVREIDRQILAQTIEGGVAADAKRVLRGQPPLQSRPEEDDGT